MTNLSKMASLVLLLLSIPVIIYAQNIDNSIKSKQQVYSDNIIGTPQIKPAELIHKMNSNHEFILIDLRTEREHDAGYISGSVWIPGGFLEYRIQEVCKNSKAEIIVYCRRGGRALLAVKSLQQLGYKNVYNLEGGLYAWVEKEYSLYNRHGEIKVINFEKKDPDLSTYDVIN